MDELICRLTKRPVKSTKIRKKVKQKAESELNKDLQNDLKKLKFNLENMKKVNQEKEETKAEILTPRSRQKSIELKRKMNFLKEAQSSYEFKRR